MALVGLAAATVLAGMVVGASTNTINGMVSQTYFTSVMGWQSDVWLSSVAQGILEGFVTGVVLAIVWVTAVGIITRARCEFATGVRWLSRIVLGVYVMWTIGGIAGVGLAAAAPTFFADHFIGVPADRGQMLRYAWVGGSIWGAYFGGPTAVLVGLLLFRSAWRRMLRHAAETRPLPQVIEPGE